MDRNKYCNRGTIPFHPQTILTIYRFLYPSSLNDTSSCLVALILWALAPDSIPKSDRGGIFERMWGKLMKSGDENALRNTNLMAENLRPLLYGLPKDTPIIATHCLVGNAAVACGFKNVINLVIDNYPQAIRTRHQPISSSPFPPLSIRNLPRYQIFPVSFSPSFNSQSSPMPMFPRRPFASMLCVFSPACFNADAAACLATVVRHCSWCPQPRAGARQLPALSPHGGSGE
jgi:hypothetical protein